MAYEKNVWWNLQGATPAEQFLPINDPPGRGQYLGRCNNPMCDITGVDWYNRGSQQYYCDACARHINEQCLMLGMRKVCELRA